MQRGHVKSLALTGGIWHINGGSAMAERAFLATGCHPKSTATLPPGATVLELDDALKPSRLSGL
jgi:hypothetical protein